jgi:hypothetical protein
VAKTPARRTEALPADYGKFLEDVKERVAAARTQATLAVNATVIAAYWEIGRGILERENREGWGRRSSIDSPPISGGSSPT